MQAEDISLYYFLPQKTEVAYVYSLGCSVLCPVWAIPTWAGTTFCMTPDAVAIGNNMHCIDRLAH